MGNACGPDRVAEDLAENSPRAPQAKTDGAARDGFGKGKLPDKSLRVSTVDAMDTQRKQRLRQRPKKFKKKRSGNFPTAPPVPSVADIRKLSGAEDQQVQQGPISPAQSSPDSDPTHDEDADSVRLSPSPARKRSKSPNLSPVGSPANLSPAGKPAISGLSPPKRSGSSEQLLVENKDAHSPLGMLAVPPASLRNPSPGTPSTVIKHGLSETEDSDAFRIEEGPPTELPPAPDQLSPEMTYSSPDDTHLTEDPPRLSVPGSPDPDASADNETFDFDLDTKYLSPLKDSFFSPTPEEDEDSPAFGIVMSAKSKTESIRYSMSQLSMTDSVTNEEARELKRHDSQWDVMSGYFNNMTLDEEKLEEMWTSVKEDVKMRREKNQKTKSKKQERKRRYPKKSLDVDGGEDSEEELNDEELLEILTRYVNMCQRQAKIEFKKQSQAVHKVMDRLATCVTPPVRASPLVRTEPMNNMIDPMDFEDQAKKINLEDVLMDEKMHEKTSRENEIYREKVRGKFDIEQHRYGEEEIGKDSLRKMVGHVMMSCNSILFQLDNDPKTVLSTVKNELLSRGIMRASRSRDGPRVSVLRRGIGKAMFFENINRVLGDMYDQLGMSKVKDAAPETPRIRPKKAIPKLLGGDVQITLFCLTPADWQIPYEMQMKIANKTMLGAISQFVLQRYGKPPKELMADGAWRDELSVHIIKPDGSRIALAADAFEEIETGTIIYLSHSNEGGY